MGSQLFGRRLALVLVAAGLPGALSAETVFLVTNTNDAGPGSLRQAIADANALPGADRVHFAIPGSGPHVIRPLTELTTVTGPVVIDGTTQAGASANTNPAGSGLGTNAVLSVVLDGQDLGPGGQMGLRLQGSGITVRGLVVQRFGTGIGAVQGSSNCRITGCFLGTDATGTSAVPNLGSGVMIYGDDCVVGGLTAASRNLLSANLGNGILVNGRSCRVQGNLIGTDASGLQDLGNQDWGVYVGFLANPRYVQVGGTDPGARNVISGNGRLGILLNSAVDPLVQGNLIGTDAPGTRSLRNDLGGVLLNVVTRGVLGGAAPGAGNVVSSSSGPGIEISASAVDTVVQGNHVGVDLTGFLPLGNNVGILVENPALVGGLAAGAGNLIGGNATGVRIQETSGVRVLGNTIGTDPTGTAYVPNVNGIVVRLSNDNLIFRNRISFNTSDGIRLSAAPDVTNLRNHISRNTLSGNARIGIDLGSEADGPSGVTPNDRGDRDEGPNRLQNYPNLGFALQGGGVTVIGGLLDSRPESAYVVELFTSRVCSPSEHGEGETFLGARRVVTDPRGLASFTFATTLPVGAVVSATATDAAGNTSEFSLCRPVLSVQRR